MANYGETMTQKDNYINSWLKLGEYYNNNFDPDMPEGERVKLESEYQARANKIIRDIETGFYSAWCAISAKHEANVKALEAAKWEHAKKIRAGKPASMREFEKLDTVAYNLLEEARSLASDMRAVEVATGKESSMREWTGVLSSVISFWEGMSKVLET